MTGPRAVSGATTQAVSGFVQTTAAAFGLWRFRFTFPNNIRKQLFRRYRGWVTALHGGANATRVPLCDWDGLKIAERGITSTYAEWAAGVPFENGDLWSNGEYFGTKGTSPLVSVSADADRDATIISLADTTWGHGLDYGDQIGFMPFHFGMYMVTEVISAGEYRIWPPLRKAITTSDHATLEPVLVMRMDGEDGATAARGSWAGEGLSVTLVEVLDYDVTDYFSD